MSSKANHKKRFNNIQRKSNTKKILFPNLFHSRAATIIKANSQA